MNTTSYLNDAVRYIEKRLFDVIDFTEAARIACCSEYQFRRIFSYLAGMPLNEYIRKRRLSLITEQLYPGDARIIDLAYRCGYETPDAFGKAFAAQFGITPSAYRKKPVPLTIFPPHFFHISLFEGIGANHRVFHELWQPRHNDKGGHMYKLSDFTNAERDKCLPVVAQIIECANITRAQGVLALEEWCKQHENTFITFMLLMVCDGTNPELVRDIGVTLIDSGDYKGEELLSRLMTVEGVLSIQAGENPVIIEKKLFSMLGEKYLMAKGYMSTDGNPHYPEYERRYAAMAAKEGIPGSEFDAAFEALSNRDIQMVLRETDQHDLSLALKASGGTAAVKIMGNLSKRLAAMILEEMELMGTVTKADALTAQGKLLDTVKRLSEMDGIVYTYG
ncbi:MAG: helix-turn-helix domain-containing protein [Defluviitaleaceae bacterium]|nr:helix-turn-helix domain-containing protein [Defluviitaleaceae bacterium]